MIRNLTCGSLLSSIEQVGDWTKKQDQIESWDQHWILIPGHPDRSGEAYLSPFKLGGAGVGEAIRDWGYLGSQPVSNLRWLDNRGREANLAGERWGASRRTSTEGNDRDRKMRLGSIYTGSNETWESLCFPSVVILSPCWSYGHLGKLLEILMPSTMLPDSIIGKCDAWALMPLKL